MQLDLNTNYLNSNIIWNCLICIVKLLSSLEADFK